jgi:hypothetical protein
MARALANQTLPGALRQRQPCSAASQPQPDAQAHAAAPARSACDAPSWQPHEQVLPAQVVQGHEEVSSGSMDSSEGGLRTGWVRAMNSAHRWRRGLERKG